MKKERKTRCFLQHFSSDDNRPSAQQLRESMPREVDVTEPRVAGSEAAQAAQATQAWLSWPRVD